MSVICLNTYRVKKVIKELSVSDIAIKSVKLIDYADIRESIEARFGETLPKHFGRCMAEPQKQPYMYGDVHNVQYRIKSNKLFNSPYPVPCEVTTDSCHRVQGVLTLGTNCIKGDDEPFPWMDCKYEVSLNFLKSIPNDTKLNIFTRSDLIAHDDYINELKRLDVNVTILYTSDNDEINRQTEPGAPSYKRRLKAACKLNMLGIHVELKKHNIKVKLKVG